MKEMYRTQFGDFFVDTAKDRKIAKLLRNNLYQHTSELDSLLEFIGAGDVVCDIGAHIGTTTVPFARRAKTVHAFEPMPSSAETLRENILLNALTNVTVHQVGLAERIGELAGETKNKDSAATFMLGVGGESRIPVRTLDSVLERGCSFIKIDVEGMEPVVLRGAEKTIRICRPAIYFELNVGALRLHGHRPSDIARILRGHKYRFYLFLNSNLHPVFSLTWAAMALSPREWFFHQHSGIFNVLALPAERPVKVSSNALVFAFVLLWELMKRTAYRFEPILLYKALRRLGGRSLRFARFYGRRYYCSLCNNYARTFTPITSYAGQKTIEKYQIIAMGKNPHYRCPWCNSSDKERLVWAYLKFKTDFLTTKRPLSVLHIAPERNTRNHFKARPNVRYVSGDKFEGAAKYTPEHYGGAHYLDITDLQEFDDESFDLIICNHVLEHVLDDQRGMRELFRVLKKGGTAILQVPVSKLITKSIENSAADTPEKRIEMFGQEDHVRIYAEADYLARLREAGFIVTALSAGAVLSPKDANLWGINKSECVYVAQK